MLQSSKLDRITSGRSAHTEILADRSRNRIETTGTPARFRRIIRQSNVRSFVESIYLSTNQSSWPFGCRAGQAQAGLRLGCGPLLVVCLAVCLAVCRAFRKLLKLDDSTAGFHGDAHGFGLLCFASLGMSHVVVVVVVADNTKLGPLGWPRKLRRLRSGHRSPMKPYTNNHLTSSLSLQASKRSPMTKIVWQRV